MLLLVLKKIFKLMINSAWQNNGAKQWKIYKNGSMSA